MPNYSGEFQAKPLPIVGGFNLARFNQAGSADTANWYVVNLDDGKNQQSFYPCMGRSHIFANGQNQLIFPAEPRGLFKSVNYAYVVVGNVIYRVDSNYQMEVISGTGIRTLYGPIWFTYLVVSGEVFACFVDTEKIYIYQESTASLVEVTDPNAPGNFNNNKPGYIAAFGNRIVVSIANSSEFVLSQVNLGGNAFDPATCFTVAGFQVFAQANGIIRQMGVLNNTLYLFCDYITDVWSNTPAVFSGTNVSFPWKQNTTYNWNYGIASPGSLDVDFGIMAWLARNSDGLLQYMYSENGGQPQRFSNKAVDTILQRYTNQFGQFNPFLSANANGFLYQYENTIFYRASGGDFSGSGLLDQEFTNNCFEYSFESQMWERPIEYNGERNRAHLHVYFNFKHLITVIGEGTVYNLSGQYYYNEQRNINQPDVHAVDAYIAYPIRYERVTPIIYQEDYSEFETEYVQIDFVFGDSDINYSTAPFINTQFIIAEQPDSNGNPQYIIAEQPDADGQPVFLIANQGNTPGLLDKTYNYLYNPHIELFFSDDGGINFLSADVREFSQMGVYSWRMRWYQLGMSRNRVYKLICVSAVPIVVLGGVMNVRRASGGAN